MKNKPERNEELEVAKYVADAIGDECGTVFVSKQILLRKDGTHAESFNIAAFHGATIAAHVMDEPRLDRAALQAVRKFFDYMATLQGDDCQNCYGQGNGCGDDYSCPCKEGE